MHGIIHLELQRFAETRHGSPAWPGIVAGAGVPYRFAYVRVGEYPDEEFTSLVGALALRAGVTPQTILLEFGRFIAPMLLTLMPEYVQDKNVFDLLADAEYLMHRMVRERDPGAQPPRLRCVRTDDREVVITYQSARRMCAFGRGIILGVARHYDEAIAVDETSCMLLGHEACRLVISDPLHPIAPPRHLL
jgi:predicted hydrocarbon binding protein